MAGPQILTRLSPHLPVDPGSYALLLNLPEPARIVVGRLGEFDFPAGSYLYFGSARGPGGLRGRLVHHLRPAERPHWHIDYLRAYAGMEQVWWSVEPGLLECTWSQTVARLPGTFLPAPGFGASDCHRGCLSHLIGLAESVTADEITTVITPSGHWRLK